MRMRKTTVPRIAGFCFVSVLTLGTIAGIAWADDEQTLDQKATAMNKASTSPKLDEARVQALAKQFNVPESQVTDLRNKKMGWGEITISLSMAQHLATSSKTPMTTEQALTKIEQLRSEKMGWGKIAKDLGFKLGPVVSTVDRGERAIHTAEREAVERVEHKAKAEQAEKAERAEKAQRQERMEHPERMERPERVERPERPERPGR